MGQVTPADVPAGAELTAKLAAAFGEALSFVSTSDAMLSAVLNDPSQLLAVAQVLRDEHGLRHLADVTAVDYLPREPRFEVVYHFSASGPTPLRFRLKVPLAEGAAIDSVTGLWKGANFSEREVFDLFGISFSGHPNLERILLPDDYEGYPLRRDHPLGDIPIEFDLPYRKRFGHA